MDRGVETDIKSLIKRIDSVNITFNCDSEKPDLIGFYNKYTSSVNKAVVHLKPIGDKLEIIYSSDNIFDIMGYTPEQLKGSSILDYRVSSVDFKMIEEMLSKLDAGETIVKSNKIKHADGSAKSTRGILFKDGDIYIEFVWLEKDEFNME